MDLLSQHKLSPMMAQWYRCKKQAKGGILLFRLGDFYEAFYDDGILLSQELSLTLTQRQGVPMSGIPVHASETYIQKLVEKGFLVAVAEQIEGAQESQGLVKREIVRTISPGTMVGSSFLTDNKHNFFACLTRSRQALALALLDLSTGVLRVMELNSERELQNELFKSAPSEILLSTNEMKAFGEMIEPLKKECHFRLTLQEDWLFDLKSCISFLTRHFRVHNLDGFGLQGRGEVIRATGALLAYIQDELHLSISHIKSLTLAHPSTYMAIDRTTQRNLELVHPPLRSESHPTLLQVLDYTQTAMGARLFKLWMLYPLLSVKEIGQRQDSVEELLAHWEITHHLREGLKKIHDLERIMTRISMVRSNPRDLTGIRNSLKLLPALFSLLHPLQTSFLIELRERIPDTIPLTKRLQQALVDTPPSKRGEGDLIRPHFSEKLDDLRAQQQSGQKGLLQYQEQLKEELGIKHLKVVYSKTFGYCLEISRGQISKVPPLFQRRQTLANAERYSSPELRAQEEHLLSLAGKIVQLEQTLYEELLQEVIASHDEVMESARAVARLDCLCSLAYCAKQFDYCRPVVDGGQSIEIREGRHPVVEASSFDHSFVPNSVNLDPFSSQLLLITGPNMAGKSTYIRQTGLIVIMAQMGSFVPARFAHIGVIDKLFSRIGAHDDLFRGQSTFMVEMAETANILRNATSRSLVLLDEIGRGTSTYDGIAIAWAVVEHLLQIEEKGVKTLFATHYWELIDLADHFSRVKNFHVAIEESKGEITFLYQIKEGSTDKSYGIHVAQLAGLPRQAVRRAQEILKGLHHTFQRISSPSPEAEKPLPSSSPSSLICQKLIDLDPNEMTPIIALQTLVEWQSTLKSVPNL